MILLTSPACSKCNWLKRKLSNRFELKELGINTPEGLMEAVDHNLDPNKLELPILIDGNRVISGSLNCLHYLEGK